MRQRSKPPPKAKRCLDAIKAITAKGEQPTYDRLMVELDRSKNAVREAVRRLVDGGWIKTTKYRPGGTLSIRVTKGV